MLHGLVAFWFTLLEKGGYLSIIVLMAMESSIFPVPSEVVIPPAAFWATRGAIDPLTGLPISFWGVVIAGTIGSYLGSAITYWVALKLGPAFIAKFGKWVHITPDKVARAERFVHRYESGGIFFARLLPVVRHLISIPAGLVKMNFATFSLMTTIGSFLWCLILAKFSLYVFEKHPEVNPVADPGATMHLIKHESVPLIGGIVILCGLYMLAMKLTAPKKEEAQA